MKIAREVEALVRLPNPSIRAYSLSKQRLCARCPVALTEPQVIKRLVKGLNSSSFKSVVISGDPQTLVEYYNIIRRLDDADGASKVLDAIFLHAFSSISIKIRDTGFLLFEA